MNAASNPERHRPTLRTLAVVAAWGVATTVVAYLVAYLLADGSIPVFVAAMIVIGVAQRVLAVRVARRRGDHPPSWWKV